MIISEKGLCKCMTDAAAHGGYRIRFAWQMAVMTDEWMVNVNLEMVPRKVLGLIVEHFGYLPNDGCFSVRKTKDDVEVQDYMNDTFAIDVKNITEGKSEAAMYTGITVWNKEHYISESGVLRGANPVHFGLLEKGKSPTMHGGVSLIFEDEDSGVFISVCDNSFLPEAKRVMWDALERIDWWKDKEEKSAGCDGDEGDYEQTEIEAGEGEECK